MPSSNDEVMRINEDVRLNLSAIGSVDNTTSCDNDDEFVSSFQRKHKVLMGCPINGNAMLMSSSTENDVNHSVDET